MQRLLWTMLLAAGMWGAVPAALTVYAQEAPSEAGAQAPTDDAGAVDEGAAEAGAPAEDAAPETPPAPAPSKDKWNDSHSIPRSPNAAFSWAKLLFLVVIFLIWVRSADWVNVDSQIFDMGYGKWNPIMFFPFLLAMLLVFLLLSNFIVGAVVLPVVFLATYLPYVLTRNKSVELHQKVFTGEWFRYQIAHLGSKVGLKIDAERKAEYDKGAPVDLLALGADEDRTNQANLLTARQSPGYLFVKDLIVDMAERRADRAMLDYTQQSVVARYHIDGVWHNGEARDRESGDVMLAVMKTLANLNMTERRKKQTGKFGAKYKDHSYVCPIVSQGVTTGERVVIDLLGGYQRAFKTYDDLGMRHKLVEQWSELMSRDKGLLIIAGLPEGGVTTLTDVSLMETDRLMRDFFSIEELHHREREVENIEVVTYDETKGETPATILPKLIRRYPNVYVIRSLSDTEAAKLLLNEIRDDRLVITNVNAKDSAEALLRMLQLKVPQRDFAATVTAVMCTRLIRKLCDNCKVGYAPTPDLLKKLGIPAGKVEALYRTPKPEEIDKPCPECANIGFKGRTAIFELLEVDDKIREILVKQPNLELLRKAARAAGTRSFQEEGVLLVAKGVTSLAEVQRVLKQ